jgi:thiosulfate/3-mercaptopyruvate sulfurtransferase
MIRLVGNSTEPDSLAPINKRNPMKTAHSKQFGIRSRKARRIGIITLLLGTLGLTSPVAHASDVPARTTTVAADKLMVDGAWLDSNLTNPKVKIIEVSTDTGLYQQGHITGASNFSWHTDFVDPVNRDIVSRSRFQKLVRQAGINNDSTVVLYGDKNNWFAAWGVWIFKTYGFKDVRLLNGGRDKWIKDGRALTPIPPATSSGNFTATAAKKSLRASLADVLTISTKKDKKFTKLIDIRSPDEFSGKIFAPAGFQELAIRAGHIPGAVNVPWGTAVNSDGTIKSVEQLREIYKAVGVTGKRPIIVYCRIGERAAHTWFVLSQLLGYNVRLYDGSWTEYGNTVGVPINNPTGTVWGRG